MHLHGVELNGKTLYWEELSARHIVLSSDQAGTFARALDSVKGSGRNGGSCRDKLNVKSSGCFFVVQS